MKGSEHLKDFDWVWGSFLKVSFLTFGEIFGSLVYSYRRSSTILSSVFALQFLDNERISRESVMFSL